MDQPLDLPKAQASLEGKNCLVLSNEQEGLFQDLQLGRPQRSRDVGRLSGDFSSYENASYQMRPIGNLFIDFSWGLVCFSLVVKYFVSIVFSFGFTALFLLEHLQRYGRACAVFDRFQTKTPPFHVAWSPRKMRIVAHGALSGWGWGSGVELFNPNGCGSKIPGTQKHPKNLLTEEKNRPSHLWFPFGFSF